LLQVFENLEGIASFVFGPPPDNRARFYARRAAVGCLGLVALLLLLPLCFADQSFAREVAFGSLAGVVSLVAALAAGVQMRSAAEASRAPRPAETPVPQEETEPRIDDSPASILYGRHKRQARQQEVDEAVVALPLGGVDLRNSNLARITLASADLSGSLLREADLREATLAGTDLREADLEDADLRGADLRGADLRGCSLQGALIDDRTKPPAGIDLRALGARTRSR
jgi:hypothetical protein